MSVFVMIIESAVATWLTKNSPKFFNCNLAFLPSTTVHKMLSFKSSPVTFFTALTMSDNFPTPEGSIIILSGLYVSTNSLIDASKSPTKEQQIQPALISLILTPASFKKEPSIPISPNSFSIKTTFSFLNFALSNNFLITVVFPAPKNHL
jgi:branched-subunit amino acid transport protein